MMSACWSRSRSLLLFSLASTEAIEDDFVSEWKQQKGGSVGFIIDRQKAQWEKSKEKEKE